jgi:hypothetical protein
MKKCSAAAVLSNSNMATSKKRKSSPFHSLFPFPNSKIKHPLTSAIPKLTLYTLNKAQLQYAAFKLCPEGTLERYRGTCVQPASMTS